MSETDLQLLARYTRQHAEDAFAEIVRRHVNLVFSASLRQVRSTTLAEEVTQSVFADLARQAPRLAANTILSAWLYQVTRRTAIDLVRREARRQAREQVACDLNAMNTDSPDWCQVEPLLEEAMLALDHIDRAAILLRYFENKSLREVGENLGTSEDAARKRVHRAVERLRHFFARRGVTAGASGIVTLISCHAVQSAPAGLATAITTASTLMAGTAAAATTTQVITMTAFQKTLLVATSAIAIGAPLLVHQHSTKALRQRDDQLLSQNQAFTELQAENLRLSNLVHQPVRDPVTPAQQSELLRLRSEVAQGRAAQVETERLRAELARLRAAQNQAAAAVPQTSAAADEFPKQSWTFAGYGNPEATLLSVAWAGANGNLEAFLNSMTAEHRDHFQSSRQGKSDADQTAEIAAEFARTKSIRILKKEALSEDALVLKLLIEQENGQSEMPQMKMQRIGNEWKMAGPYKSPGAPPGQ